MELKTIFFYSLLMILSVNLKSQSVYRFSDDSTFSPLLTGCPDGTENIPAENKDFEETVIVLLNMERVSKGLPPLKQADELTRAARFHSSEMCKYRYFNHNSMDSSGANVVCTSSDRVKSFYNYTAYGENIAQGQTTPESVTTTWINSQGHYQNMMSTNFREVGVGYVNCASDLYKTRWCEDFGQRNDIYPLVINNESPRTSSVYVDLYIYCSSFARMRLRNDGENWGDWRPVQDTVKNWKLNNLTGLRTVYLELKSYSGLVIKSSQDEIEYAGPAGIAAEHTIAGLEISIYPLPADHHSVIFVKSEKKRALEMEIYDIYGRKITTIFKGEMTSFSTFSCSIPQEVLHGGFYLLKIFSEGMIQLMRFSSK